MSAARMPRPQTIAEVVHMTEREAETVLLSLCATRLETHRKLNMMRASEVGRSDPDVVQTLLDELDEMDRLSAKFAAVIEYYRAQRLKEAR